jgi:hypothetical protein
MLNPEGYAWDGGSTSAPADNIMVKRIMAILVIIELSKTWLTQISEIAIQAAIMPMKRPDCPGPDIQSIQYRHGLFRA